MTMESPIRKPTASHRYSSMPSLEAGTLQSQECQRTLQQEQQPKIRDPFISGHQSPLTFWRLKIHGATTLTYPLLEGLGQPVMGQVLVLFASCGTSKNGFFMFFCSEICQFLNKKHVQESVGWNPGNFEGRMCASAGLSMNSSIPKPHPTLGHRHMTDREFAQRIKSAV